MGNMPIKFGTAYRVVPKGDPKAIPTQQYLALIRQAAHAADAAQSIENKHQNFPVFRYTAAPDQAPELYVQTKYDKMIYVRKLHQEQKAHPQELSENLQYSNIQQYYQGVLKYVIEPFKTRFIDKAVPLEVVIPDSNK